ISATQTVDSGHALQEKHSDDASAEPERSNNQEADKKDEDTDRASEIVASDGKPILDDALFDCCHSRNSVSVPSDLQHGNGPDTYSKEWKVGISPVFKVRLGKKYCTPIHDCPPIPRLQSEVLSDTPTSDTKNATSNNAGEEPGNLSVICLSACRDNQIAHDDDEKRLTFTKLLVPWFLVLSPVSQRLIHAIAAKPDMSWEGLRDELKVRVDQIRIRCQQFLAKTPAEGEGEGKALPRIWSQEPRYSTTPHTDLTKPMEF
ncbi:hypothetical protein BU15DRAFT_65852, partial [Melanogaster broomeanus]